MTTTDTRKKIRVDSNGPLKRPLYRLLDENGDGAGNTNANGDYSLAEGLFFIQPLPGEVMQISRMFIAVHDSGGMQAQEYGNLGSALANGITIRVSDDSGVITDLTSGISVVSNAEWGVHCYDVDLKSWGAGDDLLLVRWTFEEDGQPIRLVGDNNERLEAVFTDSLVGLIHHRFIVRGKYE